MNFSKKLLLLLLTFAIILSSFSLYPTKTNAAVADWQKGATIYPKSTTMYSTQEFKQSIDDLHATGANYVGLLIPYFQSTTTSHDIARGWNTPTDESLKAGIDYIHSKGMDVFLVMHPYVLTGEWHANICPSNRDAWFQNYGNLLNKYAVISQQKGVEMMSLGVELWCVASERANPANKAAWQKLISDVKARYTGLLTYGAQHSGSRSETMEVSFWKDLDFIGLSAYYSLNRSGSTPDEALLNSWDYYNRVSITPTYEKYQKPILFTELGYRSVTNSHLYPWSFTRDGQVDLEEQARNYEALFRYWDNYDWMTGWHIWAWEGFPDAGGPNDDTFTPQNKPAEDVMKEWFGQPSSNPPPEPQPTPPPQPGSQNTVLFNPASAGVGQEVSVSGQFTMNENISSAHMIVFIFDSNWQKVAQKDFTNIGFESGKPKVFSFKWTPLSVGKYHVSIGIFDMGWQGTYWEDFMEPKLSVSTQSENPPPQPEPEPEPEPNPPPAPEPEPEPEPTPPPENPPPQPSDNPELPTPNSQGFTSLSMFMESTATVGGPVNVRSYFKSLNALSNVNVDVEIFNSSWKQVHQQIFRSESFSPSEIRAFEFVWNPTIPGKYHIKVGIFSNSWQNLYWFSQDEAILTVK